MVSASPSGRYSSELLSIPGVAFDISIADPAKRIEVYINSYRDTATQDGNEGFDDKLMREQLEVVSASVSQGKATAVFLLKGGPNLKNRLGNVHGGAVALIYDMCTTMCAAPVAREGFWQFGGVSRNLSVTYMRPMRADRQVLVECEVLQIGARLATIRGQMRDKETGNLLSVAEHNKASIEFAAPKTKV